MPYTCIETKMSIYGLTASGERKLEYQVRLNASTTKFLKLLLLVVSNLSKQYT